MATILYLEVRFQPNLKNCGQDLKKAVVKRYEIKKDSQGMLWITLKVLIMMTRPQNIFATMFCSLDNHYQIFYCDQQHCY